MIDARRHEVMSERVETLEGIVGVRGEQDVGQRDKEQQNEQPNGSEQCSPAAVQKEDQNVDGR